jgi:hypothetical protein
VLLLARFRDLDAERGRDEIHQAHIGGKVPLDAPRMQKTHDSRRSDPDGDDPSWPMHWPPLASG